ncbi:uncharacterized protein LOC128267477 [Anopheles cruzii]|uniref:uncharacterized protein LOC128267477 n=1 Tax=Anopheles cruzii TaxID=68878 RepID=UPI0022EC9393|nr:uncharacterized protein LOC128267477 [Anopheles cruzii]
MLLRYSFLCCCLVVSFVRPQTTAEIALKCASASPLACIINGLHFEDPSQDLTLQDASGRKYLAIKGGTIKAFHTKHCDRAFRTFEKVTIGRTGLEELCIAREFVQVLAENNNLHTIHPDTIGDDDGQGYKLQTLKLSHNRLTSVANLCAFHNLRELHLEHNLLSTLDMECFASMTQLERLLLGGNRINHVNSPASLVLPALSELGLQNNTLTVLKVSGWSVESLAQLQLASNNLTRVEGLEALTELDGVSLACNDWECTALGSMLAVLRTNEVRITDGDTNCEGIGGSNICCKVQETATAEGELVGELKKYDSLEAQYWGKSKELENRCKEIEDNFNKRLAEVQQSIAKKPESECSVTHEEKSKTEPPTEPTEAPKELNPSSGKPVTCVKVAPPTPAPTKPYADCTEDLKKLQDELQKMRDQFEGKREAMAATQRELTLLTKTVRHELRTAVKRGADKLRDVQARLTMFRAHVNEKCSSIKK